MKIDTIRQILKCEMYVEPIDPTLDYKSACGADLMSDVLAFMKEDGLLLSGLCNPHILRTAEMMDIRLIVFVRGKKPTQELILEAKEKGIALLSTGHTMFTACGLLYEQGIVGGDAHMDVMA